MLETSIRTLHGIHDVQGQAALGKWSHDRIGTNVKACDITATLLMDTSRVYEKL